MITTGVVGIGAWGRNLVRCFETLSDVKYCCHSGHAENARWLAESYPDIKLTEQYEAVLSDDEVDAVVVATPVGTHASIARRALAASKDVFVEKPLTDVTASATSLVDAAANRARRLFTGYVFLYAPTMRAFRRRLANDPAIHLRATWEKFGTFGAPIEWSLSCHDVAIASYLFGDPLRGATTTERVGVRTEADLLGTVFETADGRQLTASYDRTASTTRKSVIAITESGARYEFVDDELTILRDGDQRTIPVADDREPLTAECEAFVDWVEGGEAPPTGGEFGARVTEVVDSL